MKTNPMNTRKPPLITHRGGRPENWQDVVALCCKNVKLTKTASKLMFYYAGCMRGFRPALSLIEKQTGIYGKSVSRYRQQLVDHGLIGYGVGFCGMLIIDWNHIQYYANLDSPMKYDKKHIDGVFNLVTLKKEN